MGVIYVPYLRRSCAVYGLECTDVTSGNSTTVSWDM